MESLYRRCILFRQLFQPSCCGTDDSSIIFETTYPIYFWTWVFQAIHTPFHACYFSPPLFLKFVSAAPFRKYILKYIRSHIYIFRPCQCPKRKTQTSHFLQAPLRLCASSLCASSQTSLLCHGYLLIAGSELFALVL